MKKLLIIALLFMLISPTLALPDLESQLKGKAMIRESGAPWLNDDAIMYFGADKDGYIKFNSTSGYVELSGVASGVLTNGGEVGSGNDLTFAGGDSIFNAGSASGAFTTSTGTNTLSGNTVISGSKTFTTGTGSVRLKGSTLIDTGKTFTVGATRHYTNTSATNITITDTDPDFWFCGNSTEPGNQTYVLPTAADNTGRIITFIVTTNPGANYVRIDGEGAETVDGTAIQATTAGVGTLLAVICDGTKWYEYNSIGTWGGHA